MNKCKLCNRELSPDDPANVCFRCDEVTYDEIVFEDFADYEAEESLECQDEVH